MIVKFPEPVAATKPFSAISELRRARIDLKAKIPKPPVALAFKQGIDEAPVCTLGNISLVSGKAKSRKTFVISMLTAAALAGSDINDTIRSYLPEGKKEVIYFDTEQGAYHAQAAVRRAVKLAGAEDPETFTAYALREYDTAQRRQMVATALELHDNIGFVVIDGVRDLLDDINNAQECNILVTDLMRWSSRYHCHIVCVIHENKTGGQIRGHLGTELQNKAETVMKVERVKDNDEVSVVHPEMTRDKPFKPFAIGFDPVSKLPAVMHDYVVKASSRSVKVKESTKSIDLYSLTEHSQYLNKVFAVSKILKGQEVKDFIIEEYPLVNKEDVRRNALTYLIENGYLETNKGSGVSNVDVRYWLTDKVKEEVSPF